MQPEQPATKRPTQSPQRSPHRTRPRVDEERTSQPLIDLGEEMTRTRQSLTEAWKVIDELSAAKKAGQAEQERIREKLVKIDQNTNVSQGDIRVQGDQILDLQESRDRYEDETMDHLQEGMRRKVIEETARATEPMAKELQVLKELATGMKRKNQEEEAEDLQAVRMVTVGREDQGHKKFRPRGTGQSGAAKITSISDVDLQVDGTSDPQPSGSGANRKSIPKASKKRDSSTDSDASDDVQLHEVGATNGHAAPREERKTRKFEKRPMKFNGDEEWSAYYTHFRAVANHNGWDAEEQAENLAISLQGPALELFAELSQRRQTKLSSVVRALRNRFEPEGREAKYRADFHGRDRQGESPEDYARLLAKLARRAFPGIPTESREDLLLERYVRGQTSPSLKEVMSIAYPRTMEEAITSVYKHEAQQR